MASTVSNGNDRLRREIGVGDAESQTKKLNRACRNGIVLLK